MNIEKYTERARGFIQSAQSLAVREGNQQFTPEHILKVLLDDEEGLSAGLIDRAGGRSRDALRDTELALAKLPKVQGGGAGQLYLAPATARIFDNAETDRAKGGRFLCDGRAASACHCDGKKYGSRQNSRTLRRHPTDPQRGDRGAPQRPDCRQSNGRKRL